MSYRASARTAGPGSSVSFYRSGPARRWSTALVGAGLVALCLMAARERARDTWLRCERTWPGAPPACVLERRSVFGSVASERLPTLLSARADRAARDGWVIVISAGFGDDFRFTEATPARADGRALAEQIDAFLGGAQLQGAWLLQQRSLALAATFALLTLAGFSFSASAFRSTRVRFEPSERRVDVRLRRWPARSRTISVPLDAIDRAEAIGPHPGSGHTVRLRGTEQGPHEVDLLLTYQLEGAAERAAGEINEALARWRDG